MGGSGSLGRRSALALGAASVLAACTRTATPAPKGTDGNTVRTDSAPLERRFPALGPLSDAHWLGIVLGGTSADPTASADPADPADSRVSVPGPTDVRVVGFAQLKPGGGTALTGSGDPQRGFRPATPPRPPEPLVEFMPEDARWVRSESFDDEMTGGTYPGRFYVDQRADRVYFDTTNPRPVSTAGP